LKTQVYPYPGQPGCKSTSLKTPLKNATAMCGSSTRQFVIDDSGFVMQKRKEEWTKVKFTFDAKWKSCTVVDDDLWMATSSPPFLHQFRQKRRKHGKNGKMEWKSSYNLSNVFATDKAGGIGGLSSIEYLETKQSRTGGYFYIGNRLDGKLFVVEVSQKSVQMQGKHGVPLSVVRHIATISPPGIGFDLSSVTIIQGDMFILYNTPMAMSRITLSVGNFTMVPRITNQTLPMDINARGLWPVANYRFAEAGMQAFLPVEQQVWMARGLQGIVSYNVAQFETCFRTWG
jgi:hypothetical protein